MDQQVVIEVLAVIAVIAFFITYVNKQKGRKSAGGRTVDDLTDEDRFGDHLAINFKGDVDRLGRWRVEFMDASIVSRVGLLSESLSDHSRSFSPAHAYREIR